MTRADARCVGQAKKLLKLDGSRDRAVLLILESALAATRDVDELRRQPIELALNVSAQAFLDAEIPQRTRAAGRTLEEGARVGRQSTEAGAADDLLVLRAQAL